MESDGPFLSVEMACYHAVHTYPGGVAAVAAVFGWKASTLQNKLNPTQDTHNLSAKEAQSILELTRDPAILDAMCATIGAAWVDLGSLGEPSDMAMLDNITQTVTRVGDLSRKVHESLADGRVDDGEMLELESCAMRLARAALRVVKRAAQFR